MSLSVAVISYRHDEALRKDIYIISVNFHSYEWTIEKRFSDFAAFANLPEVKPNIPHSNTANPDKRMPLLDQFLKKVVASEPHLPAMEEFLDLERNATRSKMMEQEEEV
jgi:hypothetical protein